MRVSYSRMVKNIRDILDQASAEETELGVRWYKEANAIMKRMAKYFGISLRRACGVAAALSPGCSWEQSLDDAAMVCYSRSWVKVSTYKDNLAKALRILYGDDPVNVLGRGKVFCFFHNMLYPTTSHMVTIDRHAIRVAVGRDKLSDRDMGRFSDVVGYRKIATAYQEVAGAVGLSPPELQAVCWLAFKNRLQRKDEMRK